MRALRSISRVALPITLTLLTALALAGCASITGGTDAPGDQSPTPTGRGATPLEAGNGPTGEPDPAVELFPAGAAFDYQLGGAYEPRAGVAVVVRDRLAPPADGVYSICYLNAFQTQPGELDAWPDDLLLHDADDALVHDPDWPDEALVDTRETDEVVAIVAPWITACADAGYNAVEFDNLDTYTRADGLLTRADNLTLATALVDLAHDAGLAAAQKNAAEDAALMRAEAGFDFAIAEECIAYDECDAYTQVYGDHVLAIEYTDTGSTSADDDAAFAASLTEICAHPGRPASLMLRDRALATPTDPGYVLAVCPD
ncbi:endo alpha-1,4 polygalactosaminidase [Microbacterium sp. MC2]